MWPPTQMSTMLTEATRSFDCQVLMNLNLSPSLNKTCTATFAKSNFIMGTTRRFKNVPQHLCAHQQQIWPGTKQPIYWVVTVSMSVSMRRTVIFGFCCSVVFEMMTALVTFPKLLRDVSTAVLSASQLQVAQYLSAPCCVNSVISIDYLHLDEDVFHVMETGTRYSTGSVVSSRSISEAIEVFGGYWLASFWALAKSQADTAFDKEEFLDYLNTSGSNVRPSPPRQPSENAIESKQRTIRDIYLRLQAANSTASTRLITLQAFRISSNLYETMLHQQLIWPKVILIQFYRVVVPPDVIAAHNELIPKRNLNSNIRSKAVKVIQVAVGDMIGFFVQTGAEKWGR